MFLPVKLQNKYWIQEKTKEVTSIQKNDPERNKHREPTQFHSPY